MMTEVEHKWYVVQVLSGQEKKTKKALDECISRESLSDRVTEVLLPTERVSEVKGGEQKIVEKRIWPGYLLIKMSLNDETWQHIRHTNGVIGFLGGGAPTALSDEEVEQILQELRDKKETVTTKHKFKIGSRVKIVDGVFVNFIGTVTAVQEDKGRLNVLVSIFGRDTQVDDLEFWQVEEASDEE